MEQNKSLGLLAISRKGGNLTVGEEQVGAVARAGRARLLLVASDASDHTVRRARSFVHPPASAERAMSSAAQSA